MTTVVRDAHPPAAMVRVLNPIMRTVLRTRIGRLVRPFALIEFAGRRSGRRYRVPVGWHDADGVTVVFTPAPWRVNFSAGAPATVHHRGRAQQMTGTLVTDPAHVARALESVLARGTSPRQVGLHIPTGHTITDSDIATTGRAMIRFHPQAASVHEPASTVHHNTRDDTARH